MILGRSNGAVARQTVANQETIANVQNNEGHKAGGRSVALGRLGT